MKSEREKCTRESHALDAATLAFEILAKTRMLGRFASTVEAFNDYECAPRAWRHVSPMLCEHCGQRRSLEVIGLVCKQLRRAGLGSCPKKSAAALARTLLYTILQVR